MLRVVVMLCEGAPYNLFGLAWGLGVFGRFDMAQKLLYEFQPVNFSDLCILTYEVYEFFIIVGKQEGARASTCERTRVHFTCHGME